MADEHVDPAFGTGAVKVTPAHDPNDFEIGRRHDLPARTVLDERGVVTAPGPFEGLDRFEARPAVVAALREEGRIVAEQRPYVHAVGHCGRCDTVVEPRLSEQWFVKVEPLAKAAGDAVRDGRVTIHPTTMAQRYFDWVDNMHDWCISRQLWWGHRIPVWYGAARRDAVPRTGGGRRRLGLAPGPRRPRHLVLVRALAVLDPRLARRHPRPAPLLPHRRAAHRLRHHLLLGRPDDDVRPVCDGRRPAVQGRGPDRAGARRPGSQDDASPRATSSTRSTGWTRTAPTPLRFTLARGANPGADVPISEEWVQGSRNFATKLWNASRFALMNGATVEGELPGPADQAVVDRWILARLATVTAQVDAAYEDFQFARATETLYHFVWDELCDWYLELAKLVLRTGGPAADVTRRVLGEVLDVVLRLLHPVVPFVTEALWTELTRRDSLVVATWPVADAAAARDDEALAEVAALQKLVTEIRRFRADQGVRPAGACPRGCRASPARRWPRTRGRSAR